VTGPWKGDWKAKYPEFAKKADQYFAELAETPIRVLVWGPGEHTPYYDKRTQIMAHLAKEPDEVLTSEQLINLDRRFSQLSDYHAELVHLHMCDVVFVLIVQDQKITGVQAEVAMFSDHAEFREKAYLLRPRLDRASIPRSFLSQGWVQYDNSRCFSYTEEHFRTCNRIRAYCAAKVEELRKTMFVGRLKDNRPSR
jgi:hypothetical protein